MIAVHAAGKGEDAGPAKHHLFHDETKALFFRRLAWSPDGERPHAAVPPCVTELLQHAFMAGLTAMW